MSFVDDLIKAYEAGEAPKNMVGQTESGKPVLASGAENYAADFHADDHRDAAKIHKDKAAKYQSKQRKFMLGKQKGFNHKLLAVFSAQQAKHKENSDWHDEQAESDDDVEKGFTQALLDLFKGGPGSGRRGHKTLKEDPNRLNYPGIEAYRLPGKEEPKEEGEQTLPLHALPKFLPDHSNGNKYRKMHHMLGDKMQGNFTYDIKTDQIKVISPEGHKILEEALKNRAQPKPL